jgi:hypothetical protein
LVDTEGFRIFGGPLSSVGHANEVHALWDGVHTVALLTAVLLYAGWCGGTSGA